MKRWPFLLIAVGFALFQAGLSDSFRVFNVKPDLILICVVMAGIYLESPEALGIAVFCGLLKDALGTNSLGINTTLFPLWSFLARKLSKEISLSDDYMHLVFVFIAALANAAAGKVIFMFLGSFISWGIFLRVTFLESLYSALIAFLISRILKPIRFIA